MTSKVVPPMLNIIYTCEQTFCQLSTPFHQQSQQPFDTVQYQLVVLVNIPPPHPTNIIYLKELLTSRRQYSYQLND